MVLISVNNEKGIGLHAHVMSKEITTLICDNVTFPYNKYNKKPGDLFSNNHGTIKVLPV